MRVKELEKIVDSRNSGRSAWSGGVKAYALDLLDWCERCNIEELEADTMEEVLLNGAKDWKQYSYGGNALIYNEDIAETLCNKSELKRAYYKNGQIKEKANARETWLDVQARALFQACRLLEEVIKGA